MSSKLRKNKDKEVKEKVKKVKKPKAVKKKKVKKINYDPGKTGSRKNLILVVGAILLVIVLSATIFLTLTSLFSTENYYVLNVNVKAKQLITPEMVVARETASGTAPVNALTMEEIQRGQLYSRYPLYAGDVISSSNVGYSSGLILGIPDDWVVTSFSITSTDAVGGILGKGDYIDILGVDEEGARYIFNNVLVLSVKFTNEDYDSEASGEQTIVGEQMHYTVGMPADKVAYLHSALNDYSGSIKLIKAPTVLNYADRDVSDLDQVFKYGPNVGNIDLFIGSDPTFTEIERDEHGKPVGYVDVEEVEDEDNSEYEDAPEDNQLTETEYEEVDETETETTDNELTNESIIEEEEEEEEVIEDED